jgi:hypothetical protein
MTVKGALRSLTAFVVLSSGLLALILVCLGSSSVDRAEASHAGGMDAMSVDVSPDAAPANTATSLGSREDCARMNENNITDGDEDFEDYLYMDVTARNIPSTHRMIAWAYALTYPQTALEVVEKDHLYLLASGPGSSLLDAGEGVPDSDGYFSASAADTSSNPNAHEFGSGVLQRIAVWTLPTPATGVFPLTLSNAAHVATSGTSYQPDTFENAQVAVNTSCPAPPVDIELVSLSLVSVGGPTVNSGSDFTLEVSGTALSHGPNPADIRITLSVSGPPDCTLVPVGNQTEDFTNVLDTQTRTSVKTWTANCTDPSSHQFTASGQVDVIALADDSNLANNGPVTDSETVSVLSQTDAKVTGASVTAPPGAATGAPFTITVGATLHNNGPLTSTNVDTTFDLPMPGGCSRSPDNPQVVNNTTLANSTPVPVQASWTVTCTTTGLKTFTGTATVALDQLHVSDPNAANDSQQGQASTDTSLGQADVKVTTVASSAPPSAPVSTNFPVTVSTTVHNNGPFAPVNADIHLTLNLPPGCFTPITNIDFQDANLGPSIAAQLPDITFYVGCISHSFHNITATATIAVDDPLAGDPSPANNAVTSAPSTVAIIRTVDMKALSVTVGGPASATANSPFNVTVDASVHNNGPDSGPVDVNITLLLPTDCTAPANPRTVSLTPPVSVVTPVPTETFSVTCADESFHTIDSSISLTTPLHVNDTNAANNDAAAVPIIVPVIANADLKVSSVSASGPGSPQVNTPFDLSVASVLHNNGPFGPVNADASVSISLPGDCSTTTANPQDVPDIALPTSTGVPVNLVWSVTYGFGGARSASCR